MREKKHNGAQLLCDVAVPEAGFLKHVNNLLDRRLFKSVVQGTGRYRELIKGHYPLAPHSGKRDFLSWDRYTKALTQVSLIPRPSR